MATLAEAAAHIDLQERRFRELCDQGVLPKGKPGTYRTYDIDAVRVAYIRHIRGIAAGRISHGDLDPGQERARKDKELADRVSLQNAATRNEMFSGTIVTRLVTSVLSKVRLKLLAIPTKLAPLVVHLETIPEIQAKLRDGVNDVLRELNEESILRAAGSDTASSVGDVSELVRGAETAADSDCKPVGRPRTEIVPRSQRGAWEMGHEPS